MIEAGCGWGALALHMAREYGVRVKAFNLSREQIAYARARASREGLSAQVEFIEDDYRNVRGEYDAFVSVGMLEHVGVKHFRSLARRHLPRPAADVRPRTAPLHRPRHSASAERVDPRAASFPAATHRRSRKSRPKCSDRRGCRFSTWRTCGCTTRARWRTGAAGSRAIGDQVRARYGEEFRRAWELYLAGSEAAFAIGSLQLFQVVFAPMETPPPYWTRAEMYEQDHAGSLHELVGSEDR